MMRKLFLTIGLIWLICPLIAQQSQWASEVLDFSSQLSAYEYAAQQVLGKPNVLPNAGDNPNAWMPRREDREDYIKVGFEHPMRVQQIAIAESYHPGAITEVYLYDVNGQEYLISTFAPRPLAVEGRMLNIYLDETDYEANAAKVVINGSMVEGYNAIDAIGISGTKIPLIATQELAIINNPTLSGDRLSLNATGPVSDTRPVFIKKYNTLYFTRGYHPENIGTAEDPGDIWMTTVTPQGTMDNVRPLGEEINNYGLSTTGGYYEMNGQDWFLFGNVTGNVNQSRQNVVLARKSDDQWPDVEEQRIRNDFIVSFNADYALASRGKVLLISTLRFDTEGGRDLYICHQDGNNRWTEPVNLGKKVNTAFDEFSPFYAESESALYFSTQGFAGFGEGDIFRVIRLDSTWNNWSDPVNLGPDFNSSFDEKYYYYDEEDDYVYFARNDEDSVYHILRMERPEILESTPLVVLQGNVLNMNTAEPVSSEISFSLKPGGRNMGTTMSDLGSGEFEILIPSGYEYQVSVAEEGFDPYNKTLFLENRGEQYIYQYDIPLTVETTAPVAMEESKEDESPEPEKPVYTAFGDVFFDFDSAVPQTESIPVIDQVVEYLKENEEYKMEIAGFSDHIGSESYNQRLSQRRADRVKKYMIDKGIQPDRILARGFGEEIPEVMTYDKTELQRNRRVEFNLTR